MYVLLEYGEIDLASLLKKEQQKAIEMGSKCVDENFIRRSWQVGHCTAMRRFPSLSLLPLSLCSCLLRSGSEMKSTVTITQSAANGYSCPGMLPETFLMKAAVGPLFWPDSLSGCCFWFARRPWDAERTIHSFPYEFLDSYPLLHAPKGSALHLAPLESNR